MNLDTDATYWKLWAIGRLIVEGAAIALLIYLGLNDHLDLHFVH